MESNHAIAILQKLGAIIEKMNKETFSLDEASDFLKIPPETVEYYSKRQKQLSHINLGGTLVFRRKDLEEFLEKKAKKGFVF